MHHAPVLCCAAGCRLQQAAAAGCCRLQAAAGCSLLLQTILKLQAALRCITSFLSACVLHSCVNDFHSIIAALLWMAGPSSGQQVAAAGCCYKLRAGAAGCRLLLQAAGCCCRLLLQAPCRCCRLQAAAAGCRLLLQAAAAGCRLLLQAAADCRLLLPFYFLLFCFKTNGF